MLKRSGNGSVEENKSFALSASNITNVEGNNFIVQRRKTLTFQYLDYSLCCEPKLPPVFSKCTTTEKIDYCSLSLGKLIAYPTGAVLIDNTESHVKLC